MRDRWLIWLVALPFLMGAATGPRHPGPTLFTFGDPAIVESSGLVVTDQGFVTTNDSGDPGRVFTVDPATGRTIGVTHWAPPDGGEPTDVEALAPAGSGAVWLGDIGDNTTSRDTVQVARVPIGEGERSVEVTTYDLAYPDGPHDAETLLHDPRTGRLYLATKDVFGGELYAAPARLDPHRVNRLSPVGPVLPMATDGAFLPDGRHVVVRGYAGAVVYTFPALDVVGSFDLPDQQQGEGLAVDRDGRLFVSSEGRAQPVLRVPVPRSLKDELAGAAAPSAATPDAGPTAQPAPGASSDPVGVDRPVWPWFLTGWLLLGGLVLVGGWLRSRRRRG